LESFLALTLFQSLLESQPELLRSTLIKQNGLKSIKMNVTTTTEAAAKTTAVATSTAVTTSTETTTSTIDGDGERRLI